METRENSRKNDLAALFDKLVPVYDAAGPKMFTNFGRQLVDRAGIPPGSRILDAACGKGAVMFPALEAAGPSGEVLGIDISPAMVQWLAEEIQRRSIRNARAQVMDAEALEFPPNVFDYILCGLGIFFFPQVDLALAEFLRVLKPGGGIAVSTFGREDPCLAWFLPLVREYLPSAPGPASQSTSGGAAGPVFNTAAGMHSLFTRAGFEQIQTVPFELTTTYTDEEEWWTSLWSVATRRSLEKIESIHGRAGLERFKAQAFAQVRSRRVDGRVQKIETVLLTTARKGI
jgi:ubiquinone/menaquinone biosynthesis C-methylase UbiE